MKLKTLTNDSFIKVAARFFDRCGELMETLCEGGDGMKFGWDWPTFGVYFARRRARWHTFCIEAKRRNLYKVVVPA